MKQGSKVIYKGELNERLRMVPGLLYVVLSAVRCGGCEGESGLWINVGHKHTKKYSYCGECGNILAVDDIYFLPSSVFREATAEEVELYEEIIIEESLNKSTDV